MYVCMHELYIRMYVCMYVCMHACTPSIYVCMNLKNSVIKWLHTLHVEPLGYLALRARIGRLKIFDVRENTLFKA